MIREENIRFNIDEFRFRLEKVLQGWRVRQSSKRRGGPVPVWEAFIVFEIDSIKEHKVLFPIVTLIIMDVFIQKMRFRSRQRKALIIEEAWKAIASPLMANYILYLYKTVRKFWGEAIVVTQELGDIIGNTVVKDSIVNNSDTVILLTRQNSKTTTTKSPPCFPSTNTNGKRSLPSTSLTTRKAGADSRKSISAAVPPGRCMVWKFHCTST